MNGRKRHIAVTATRLLLAVVVTMAVIQDRDYETLPEHRESVAYISMVMVRRLARTGG